MPLKKKESLMSTWDVEPTSGIQGDLEELRVRERKMHDDRKREREKDA